MIQISPYYILAFVFFALTLISIRKSLLSVSYASIWILLSIAMFTFGFLKQQLDDNDVSSFEWILLGVCSASWVALFLVTIHVSKIRSQLIKMSQSVGIANFVSSHKV